MCRRAHALLRRTAKAAASRPSISSDCRHSQRRTRSALPARASHFRCRPTPRAAHALRPSRLPSHFPQVPLRPPRPTRRAARLAGRPPRLLRGRQGDETARPRDMQRAGGPREGGVRYRANARGAGVPRLRDGTLSPPRPVALLTAWPLPQPISRPCEHMRPARLGCSRTCSDRLHDLDRLRLGYGGWSGAGARPDAPSLRCVCECAVSISVGMRVI